MSKSLIKIGILLICWPIGQQIFDVQGHRGCQGLMPENTWPGIKMAIDLQCTTIEVDVVITKDKKVVLSHEAWFNHEITTKPDGKYIDQKEEKQHNIYQMNYAEVKKFDVGLKPHPRFPKQQKIKAYKPLLSGVFDSLRQYMKSSRRPFPFLNIEIKSSPTSDSIYHPGIAEYVGLVMAVVKQYKMEKQVIIQSFDARPLQYLHKNYPGIKVGYLVGKMDKNLGDQLTALGFQPDYYNPHHLLVTKEVVAELHRRGIKIIPWTVDELSRINQLRAMGVDGVITNYPDLLF